MKLASGWFHTCKTLLSRFHFISNGSAPFRLDWGKKGKAPIAKLDEADVGFIREMQALIASRGECRSGPWLSLATC